MGSGKSSAAINFMKKNPRRRYMYITPYLTEIDRVIAACPELGLLAPGTYGGRTKSQDLELLIRQGSSVATTHALFSTMRTGTIEALKAAGYTLIMDEVMNVIEKERMKKSDIDNFLASGLFVMAEDGEHVLWGGSEDYSGVHSEVVRRAQRGNLLYYKKLLLFWTLPAQNFEAFDEVYVLTYMFNAQIQRYYYEMCGIEYEHIGVEYVDGEYRFCDHPTAPPYAAQLIDKVKIIDDKKLNAPGESSHYKNPLKDTSLSSAWYAKGTERGDTRLEKLRKNSVNVIKTRFKCTSKDIIWTSFEEKRERVEFSADKNGKAVRCLPRHGFVACTTRATNNYRDRHYLLYLINHFLDPITLNYFRDHGVEIDMEAYSLSEFCQWLWRSAIRCGEDVEIYVPSRRMRTLLQQWLERLAAGEPY